MSIPNYNMGRDNSKLVPNENIFMPPQPNRILVCAASGYGKTTILMYLINDCLKWEKLLLAVRSPDQNIYKDFLERVGPLLKEAGFPPVEVVTSIGEIPPLEEFKPKNVNVAVFDDLVLKKGNVEPIVEFFVAGRPRNITSICLAQSYIKVDQTIRENASFIMLGHSLKRTDPTNIFNDHSTINGQQVSREDFFDMWKKANQATESDEIDPETKKPKMIRHLFTIDKLTIVPILRYRRDFNGIWNEKTRQFEDWTPAQLKTYMKEHGYTQTHL